MQSDAAVCAALEAVRKRASAFRSAVALTADQLRRQLDESRAAGGSRAPQAAALGSFAIGRIDTARLAQILAPAKPDNARWVEPVERALSTLEELAQRGDDLFRVRVEPGGDLHRAVEGAFADAGRAFAAARLASLARSGRYRPSEHDPHLAAFPAAHWNEAERRLAPPLVIEVGGGDLHAAGLADYLDGAQAFVLVVEGEAPPAPLARLISPGTLVVQTNDLADLERLMHAEGPAVAAVLPSECARFVHTPGDRNHAGSLGVSHLPAAEPPRPLGALSAFQQQEDLRLLRLLAAQGPPEAPPEAAPSSDESQESDSHGTALSASELAHHNGASAGLGMPPVDTIEALAAWLLAHVDLTDLEDARN